MTDIFVAPADKDAEIHARNGQLFMYVGRITVALETTVTPCRNITDTQLRELVAWVRTGEPLPPEPPLWREEPNGWTTHVSEPVDIDAAIAVTLAESADQIDGWSTR
jgi:hypothetical protein